MIHRTLAVLFALAGGCCTASTSTAPLTSVTIGHPATGELGAVVCSPMELHTCHVTMPLRISTRVYPVVDIAASPSCATQEADARAACPGAPGDAAMLRCLAEHGVFLDSGATDGTADPNVRTGQFIAACDEGIARIDMIEPF
jgi:hypothetical protein